MLVDWNGARALSIEPQLKIALKGCVHRYTAEPAKQNCGMQPVREKQLARQ